MSKSDPTNEDEETEAARWRNYVDSYVLVSCLFLYARYDKGEHIADLLRRIIPKLCHTG